MSGLRAMSEEIMSKAEWWMVLTLLNSENAQELRPILRDYVSGCLARWYRRVGYDVTTAVSYD